MSTLKNEMNSNTTAPWYSCSTHALSIVVKGNIKTTSEFKLYIQFKICQ